MSVIAAMDAILQRDTTRRQSAASTAQKKTAGHARGFLVARDVRDQAAFFSTFFSKNCSSSVEPFRAAVEASRSIVVVTASK